MSVKVFLRLLSFSPIVAAAIVFATAVLSPTTDAAPKPGDHASCAGIVPIGKPVKIKAPLGLPPVPIPPDNPPTEETIALGTKSIASFERTVVIGNSPFDRFYYGGDKKALSPAAQRGLKLFLNPKKGNCSVCHAIGKKYGLFTDNKFHNIGVGADNWGNFPDAGRYAQTKIASDLGAFKTPTLRNIAETAPYMHDGSQATLKDVVDHYVGGGTSNPHLDKEIHALDFLTFDERADLKAFLESLTGTLPPNVGPPADLPSVKMQTAQKAVVQ